MTYNPDRLTVSSDNTYVYWTTSDPTEDYGVEIPPQVASRLLLADHLTRAVNILHTKHPSASHSRYHLMLLHAFTNNNAGRLLELIDELSKPV